MAQRSVNKVILLGHLGADPEQRYTQSGTAVTNLRLATNESYNDRTSGERVEKTEWHRVVCWGKLAEIAGQYLTKGRQVYIEGRLQTRKWQDQEGNDRYSTEVKADDMVMLGGRGEGGSGGGGGSDDYGQGKGGGPQMAPVGGGSPPEDDDLPF